MTSAKTLVFTSPVGYDGWNRLYYMAFGASANCELVGGSEAKARHAIYTAGTLSSYAGRRDQVAVGDALTVRLNGASSSLSVFALQGALESSSSTGVAVVSGDYLALGHTTSSAGWAWARALFEATGAQVSLYAFFNGTGGAGTQAFRLANNGAANYTPFAGGLTPLTNFTTESLTKLKVKSAGKFKNVRVYVTENNSVSAVTFRSRKNGVNGNISITIGAGLTGEFTDIYATTSHEDTLAIDDEYNFSATDTTGGLIYATMVSSEYHHTTINGKHDLYAAQPGDNVSLSASGIPRYICIGGGITTFTTASWLTATLGMDGGASKFRMKVSTNTCSATQTFVWNVNGSDTALTFTVGAGQTGEFIDDTHEITLLADDLCVLKQTGGGTGTMTVQYLATLIHGTVVSPPTTGGSGRRWFANPGPVRVLT